jgi:uncharacterized MAPEG superfamily protein
MTIAFWCILIGGLLPYVAIGIAKVHKDFRRNNKDPRAWEATFEGYRARAVNAQLNGFEALPLFAAGVFVGVLAKVPQATLDHLAMAWVVARIAYLVFYLADRASARSAVWTLALGLAVAPFFIAATR